MNRWRMDEFFLLEHHLKTKVCENCETIDIITTLERRNAGLLELPSLDGRATNTQGYEKTNLPSHQARDEAQTIGGKIQLQMFTDLRQYFEYSMTWRIAWRHKWT